MAGLYSPEVATNMRFANHLLTNQTLHFSFLGEIWSQRMFRGTAQGGMHSPKLFSRILCLVFADLREAWMRQGNMPPFTVFTWPVGYSSLWMIGLLSFTGMAQLRRRLPDIIQTVRRLQWASACLSINLEKSRLLGWQGRGPLPACLHGVQVADQITFLGCVLSSIASDEDLAQSILMRAVKALSASRRLFVDRGVNIFQRAFLCNMVVVASMRWMMRALVPSAAVLRLLRIQHSTLLVWLLGFRFWTTSVMGRCPPVCLHASCSEIVGTMP